MTRFLLLASLFFLPSLGNAADPKPLSRIAFGSCANQDKPQPIWKAVVASKPELFLSLGDNIYGDTDDMKVLKEKYDRCAAVEGYQALLKTCPILATWDDHDYGKNDAGVEYPKKDESQQIFLDFYKVPKDSPRRTQKGVYHAQTFGPVGKRVQVIVLDTRYFRSPLKRGKRDVIAKVTPYIPNTDPGVTMLGEEQWKWLETQLKEPAEVRILVSSIQVISEDHPFEKWTNFPTERERLYKLLSETKANGVVVVSGDRHLAELSMDDSKIGYPLYDLTSSGLNMASKTWRPTEKNRHRVSAMPYGDNFGLIAIDWTVPDPIIHLQIRDVDGDVTMAQKIPLSILQPGKTAVAAPDPDLKLSEGAIHATDALEKIGEKVTVEMRVQATGGNEKRFFLNSEKNFRDEKNLTIVLTPNAMTGKWAKPTAAMFTNKIIRVKGSVSKFKDAPQILIQEEGQLEILDKK